MKLTDADDPNRIPDDSNDRVMADAAPGDMLALSRYIDRALVMERTITDGGVALIVKSPQGSTRYRLRAVDDDDSRLLMEKPADDSGWTPHLRVNVEHD